MDFKTFAVEQFDKIAQEKGYNFDIESSTGFCGRFQVDGFNHLIIGADLGLNSSSSQRVSNDKFFTNFFLRKDNINVIESLCVVEISEIDLTDINYPVIVKPNLGLGGNGVLLVYNSEDLLHGFSIAKNFSNTILIQEYIEKPEFRIVIFNERVYVCYHRNHFVITGDGLSSIKLLIEARNETVKKRHQVSLSDEKLSFKLKQLGLTLEYVPQKNENLKLFDAANLKMGGTWADVTGKCHKKYFELADRCAKSLGLTIAGIDLFADSIEIFDEDYKIIEVNSNPGFEYFRSEEKILAKLFSDIEEYVQKLHSKKISIG
ncbi:MAG: ATP-grasp domain-containing protein [Pyrinomonadaceae bacterium]